MTQLTGSIPNDELTDRLRGAAGVAGEIAASSMSFVPTNTLREVIEQRERGRRPRRQRVVVTTGFVIALCGLVAIFVVTLPGKGEVAPTKPAHHATGPLPLGIAYVDPNASVQFLNDSTGYLFTDPGGGPGQVVKTSDGGDHWHKVFQENSALIGLDFVDADHGWITGPQVLFATTNGGRTWSTLREPPGGFQFVDFATPSEGWAITSEGKLMATTDGGVDWNSVSTPANVLAACLASPSSGWVVLNGNGDVEGTINLGRTWSRQHMPSPGPIVGVQLRCTANSAVLAAQIHQGGGNVSYDVTSESGTPADSDWSPIPRQSVNNLGFITGISIQGEQVAVVSDCGNQCYEPHAYLAMSTDLGRASRFVQFETRDNIYSADVSFADPENGWVVIGAGTKPAIDDIFVTSDGGLHWRIETAVPQFP
jgi:photosystem II stability/assembly factor-like uncharacterized protein